MGFIRDSFVFAAVLIRGRSSEDSYRELLRSFAAPAVARNFCDCFITTLFGIISIDASAGTAIVLARVLKTVLLPSVKERKRARS